MTPLAILTFVRSHWKLIGIGLFVAALGIQTLRLAWLQTAFEKIAATVKVMQAQTEATDRQYRITENTWRVNTASIRKERDDEIENIAAERDAALAELRKRPRRPAPGTPEATGNGQAANGCTGAQLYQDDATAFVREAARADEIRVHLKACYAQYDMISETPQ